MKKIQDETYWSDIVSAFPILYDGIEKPESCDDDTFFSIKNMIIKKKKRNTVRNKVLNNILKEMSLDIRKSFLPYICNNEVLEGSFQHLEENVSTEFLGFELYKDAINKFYNLYQSHMNTIKRLQMLYEDNENNMSKDLSNRICALLRSQLPANYIVIIYNFYRTALRIIMKVVYNFPKCVYKCTGCSFETDHCKCDYILNILYVTNGQLNSIGFLKSLVVNVIIELMNEVIQTEVELTIKLNFEYQQLFNLEMWFDCKVYNWIQRMFLPQLSRTAIIDNSSLKIIMYELEHLLFKSFLKTRIQQLYDIILKYPYSKAVVMDLVIIQKKIKFEPELYEVFKNILQNRLLQPFMNTIDIIRVYMTAIRVLKIIDPTGLLLEEITQPIREYLQKRKDTVPSIIFMLIEDKHNLDNKFKSTNISLNICDQFTCSNLAYTSKSVNKTEVTDIVTLLVGIKESPKVFQNEYKVLLADYLISQSMKLSGQIYILNLLKSIFGNSLLESCDVMIRDMFESVFININVHTKRTDFEYNGNYQCFVQALIVSEYYWPKFKNSVNVKLPKIIRKHLEFYKICFESYRKNRTLIWKPNIGQITIDIILNNEILHFTVSPIHATIIWHYQKQVEWTIENLSKKMNVPTTTLRRYITFWINQGLLIRNTSQSFDTYTLVQKLPKKLSTDHWQTFNECMSDNYGDDGTTDSAIVSAQEQRDEELQEFWLYIENILRKQHCMPLNEIQRLLKVFFPQETELEMNTKNFLKDLKTLLDNKIKEQRLTFSDGLYTLVE